MIFYRILILRYCKVYSIKRIYLVKYIYKYHLDTPYFSAAIKPAVWQDAHLQVSLSSSATLRFACFPHFPVLLFVQIGNGPLPGKVKADLGMLNFQAQRENFISARCDPSCETTFNSSSVVVFTAPEYHHDFLSCEKKPKLQFRLVCVFTLVFRKPELLSRV